MSVIEAQRTGVWITDLLAGEDKEFMRTSVPLVLFRNDGKIRDQAL